MKKRVNINDNDIFRFKVGELGWGYGQIIVGGKLQYIVIFEPIFKADSTIEEILNSRIMLAGWTTDAEFYHGYWEVVINYKYHHKIKFPNFKVGVGDRGETWVTDFKGRHLR